jgi:hypothetical protein
VPDGELGQPLCWFVGVKAVPDFRKRALSLQLACGSSEDRPAAVAVEVGAQLTHVVESASTGDDEQDSARLVIFVPEL